MFPTSAQGFQGLGWGPPLLCLSPRHPQGELDAVGCLTRGSEFANQLAAIIIADPLRLHKKLLKNSMLTILRSFVMK